MTRGWDYEVAVIGRSGRLLRGGTARTQGSPRAAPGARDVPALPHRREPAPLEQRGLPHARLRGPRPGSRLRQQVGRELHVARRRGGPVRRFRARGGDADPQTYQVPRERFDDVLLRHAQRSRAEVLQGTRALDAIFDDKGATLNYIDPKGLAHTVRVGAVVDASSRAGFPGQALRQARADPVLRNVAVHAQFEACPPRGTPGGRHPDGHASRPRVVLVHPHLPDGHERGRGHPQDRPRRSRPPHGRGEPAALHRRDAGGGGPDARGTARLPGRFDADYSYLHSQHAGDRWVLVGDAAGSWIRSSRQACSSPCSRESRRRS